MAQLRNIEAFDYDDVRLLPGKNVVASRSKVDTSVNIGEHVFNLPVIPANMSTIIDVQLAEKLATEGYFYVMHRFDIDPIQFTKDFHDKGLIASISLGVQAVDYEHVENLANLPKAPEFITVDIAHGHAESVAKIVSHIAAHLPETFIIAGNIATPEAAIMLENAGAHALKVGIGPGMSCITSPNTGFGTRNWQLSAVEQVALSVSSALVIADGGIRNYGDIAKSLAFGADLVMIGGMFAGHDENPGEVITENGEQFKVFFGSASEHQKGEKKHVEGKKMLLPYKGSIDETFRTIKENLQSSVSYAGGTQLSDLYNTEYIFV